MSLSAIAFHGIPPGGLGVFTRGSLLEGPWRWYAADPRIGGGALVRQCLTRGPCWLFQGPDAWRPETWRATLAAQLAAVRALGATGIIANPEAGWERASREEKEAFGAALRAASFETRIGVVTIPSWGPFEIVARAAGRGVWWSMELYSQSAREAMVPALWARWTAIVGRRLIPTLAGFDPPADSDGTLDTPEGYSRYLDSIPRTGGAIVWAVHGDLRRRPYMVDQLAARYGGIAGSLMLAPFTVLSALDTVPGLVYVGVGLLLAALFALAALRMVPRGS